MQLLTGLFLINTTKIPVIIRGNETIINPKDLLDKYHMPKTYPPILPIYSIRFLTNSLFHIFEIISLSYINCLTQKIILYISNKANGIMLILTGMRKIR